MGHHRLLLVDGHPVEEVHLLGLVVVEAGDLLGEQAEQEGPHLEALVEQAELLEHQFAALHAFGALVLVELLAQFGVNCFARDEVALYGGLDGQQRVLADKGQDLVLIVEQRLLLLRRKHRVGGNGCAPRRRGGGRRLVAPCAPLCARDTCTETHQRTCCQYSLPAQTASRQAITVRHSVRRGWHMRNTRVQGIYRQACGSIQGWSCASKL